MFKYQANMTLPEVSERIRGLYSALGRFYFWKETLKFYQKKCFWEVKLGRLKTTTSLGSH